jgi:hypothetical protein
MMLDPIALIQVAERSGSESRSALPDAPRRARQRFAGFKWMRRASAFAPPARHPRARFRAPAERDSAC